MVTTFPATRPMIADSTSILTRAQGEIECLAVAPNDPRMLSSLSEALGDRASAILMCDGDPATLESSVQADLEASVDAGEIAHLVFVGSTASPQQIDRSQPGPNEERGDRFNRLLNGARQQSQANRESQAKFADGIRRLMHKPAIERRCAEGSLRVTGLLYRACDAVFLVYDPSTDRFLPLAAQW